MRWVHISLHGTETECGIELGVVIFEEGFLYQTHIFDPTSEKSLYLHNLNLKSGTFLDGRTHIVSVGVLTNNGPR